MSPDEFTPGNIVGLGAGEVSVKDWRILRLSGIDFQPGGLSTGNSIAHCRVLDIPYGAIVLVPVDRIALQAIMGQIEKILREDELAENAEIQR